LQWKVWIKFLKWIKSKNNSIINQNLISFGMRF
jgi:hypothetical protein